MRRRRRRPQEVPFSFDSFLDVVANVCGIVIRLILVAWVGARSYPSIQRLLAANSGAVSTQEAATEEVAPPEHLVEELAAHRRDLEDAQAQLLAHTRQWEDAKTHDGPLRTEIAKLTGERNQMERNLRESEQKQATEAEMARAAALSLDELRGRRKKLLDDLRSLENMSPESKVLRYQTPVSQPVQAEQFMFECRGGRVTFFDLPRLEAELRREVDAKAELLKSRWQFSDVTIPIGAFRLRYTVDREPGVADSLSRGSSPARDSGYRYGVAGWVAEPLLEGRGEELAAALSDGSDFRRITDALDPRQAVVTFWVYPDSFETFRRLRDHLYERELVVAGRPLPLDAPIAASRHGSVSRGQ
jgi:hypothetical protein